MLKLLKLVVPVLIYDGITIGVAILFGGILKAGLMITVVSALISLPFLFYLYNRDKLFWGEGKRRFPWSFRSCLILIMLGTGSCILGNNLIRVSGIMEFSKSYQSVVETLYQLPPVWLQFVGTCMIIPVIEELIFRGLIFKVIRREYTFLLAASVSSLIFGMYHGNLVQFLYASFLGMILCYCYQYYQTLVAPVVLHGVANLTSILVSNMPVSLRYDENIVTWILVTVISLFVVWMGFYLMKKEILPMVEKGEES